jgi:hypothetical protein
VAVLDQQVGAGDDPPVRGRDDSGVVAGADQGGGLAGVGAARDVRLGRGDASDESELSEI